jgi:hypothetical protein
MTSGHDRYCLCRGDFSTCSRVVVPSWTARRPRRSSCGPRGMDEAALTNEAAGRGREGQSRAARESPEHDDANHPSDIGLPSLLASFWLAACTGCGTFAVMTAYPLPAIHLVFRCVQRRPCLRGCSPDRGERPDPLRLVHPASEPRATVLMHHGAVANRSSGLSITGCSTIGLQRVRLRLSGLWRELVPRDGGHDFRTPSGAGLLAGPDQLILLDHHLRGFVARCRLCSSGRSLPESWA